MSDKPTSPIAPAATGTTPVRLSTPDGRMLEFASLAKAAAYLAGQGAIDPALI